MREDPIELGTIMDELLGPERPPHPAPAPPIRSTAPPERVAIHDLMAWVSQEVFGPAA